jgi:predicted N-acetyltransferase YhbS
LSLVADSAGMVVGHVAFSRAILSDGAQHWQTLGPISVLPDRQGEGIGRALVETGVARLRTAGVQGIVLLGSPDYYRRFGFERETSLHLEGPLAPHLQVLALAAAIPTASVRFATAFGIERPAAGHDAS